MNTEVVPEAQEAQLLKCQHSVERFYNRFWDHMLKMNLPFSGEPLPNGSPPHVSAGNTLLPSRTEIADLGALITLALNYWVQYGQLPTVEQMRSSAENMESDTVVYITMLYSLAMHGAFLTCVCAGDLDRAVSALRASTPEEEQRITSQSMPPRMRVPTKIGPSTEEPKFDKLTKQDFRIPSESEQPATTSTSSNGRKPKKKARKSRREHKLKKKAKK